MKKTIHWLGVIRPVENNISSYSSTVYLRHERPVPTSAVIRRLSYPLGDIQARLVGVIFSVKITSVSTVSTTTSLFLVSRIRQMVLSTGELLISPFVNDCVYMVCTVISESPDTYVLTDSGTGKSELPSSR